MRWIALLIVAGLPACNLPAPNDAALCRPLYAAKVTDLRRALVNHPETPDPVGDAATDVVLGHEAGCAA